MNWVSKALYLERKIKKLEEMIEHLTSHIQVDEDGNVVIEANNFDVSANSDVKIKSFNNTTILSDNSINITSDNNDVTIFANNNLNLQGDNKTNIYSYSESMLLSGVGFNVDTTQNIVLKTDTSIELQPTDRLTSTKALEVVE